MNPQFAHVSGKASVPRSTVALPRTCSSATRSSHPCQSSPPQNGHAMRASRLRRKSKMRFVVPPSYLCDRPAPLLPRVDEPRRYATKASKSCRCRFGRRRAKKRDHPSLPCLPRSHCSSLRRSSAARDTEGERFQRHVATSQSRHRGATQQQSLARLSFEPVLALRVELCSPRLIASRAEARWRPSGCRPGFWPQGQSRQSTPACPGSALACSRVAATKQEPAHGTRG